MVASSPVAHPGAWPHLASWWTAPQKLACPPSKEPIHIISMLLKCVCVCVCVCAHAQVCFHVYGVSIKRRFETQTMT